jgi:hypothetical protein
VLDDHSAGFEDGLLVFSDVVQLQKLASVIGLESDVLGRGTCSLYVSGGPGDIGVNGDRLDPVPLVRAAVDGHDAIE